MNTVGAEHQTSNVCAQHPLYLCEHLPTHAQHATQTISEDIAKHPRAQGLSSPSAAIQLRLNLTQSKASRCREPGLDDPDSTESDSELEALKVPWYI